MFVHHLRNEQSLRMVGDDKAVCIPRHDDASSRGYIYIHIHVCVFSFSTYEIQWALNHATMLIFEQAFFSYYDGY